MFKVLEGLGHMDAPFGPRPKHEALGICVDFVGSQSLILWNSCFLLCVRLSEMQIQSCTRFPIIEFSKLFPPSGVKGTQAQNLFLAVHGS